MAKYAAVYVCYCVYYITRDRTIEIEYSKTTTTKFSYNKFNNYNKFNLKIDTDFT